MILSNARKSEKVYKIQYWHPNRARREYDNASTIEILKYTLC